MSNDNNISFISMNCQGLSTRDGNKRRDVLNYLRSQKSSITFLQDTHLTKEIENTVRSEWGYECLFSSFTSQSRGVAILFRNNFEFRIDDVIADPGGNFLIANMHTNDVEITLVNIYAPNNDNPDFFHKIKELILRTGNANIVMGGDFNLLLDPDMDGKNYKHTNNKKSRGAVLQLIPELNLYDVWRDSHMENRTFTWRRKLYNNSIQQGRLDFFLVSDYLTSLSKNEKIKPGYRTDHSCISFTIQFKMQKGRTLWKFNNSLLKNTHFIKTIKDSINETKLRYAASPYNPDGISDIDNLKYQPTISYQLFLEMLLLEIRGKSISRRHLKENRQMRNKSL